MGAFKVTLVNIFDYRPKRAVCRAPIASELMVEYKSAVAIFSLPHDLSQGEGGRTQLCGQRRDWLVGAFELRPTLVAQP